MSENENDRARSWYRFAWLACVACVAFGLMLVSWVPMNAQLVPTSSQPKKMPPQDRRGDPSWTVPRTPDGQPDLQGVWDHAFETPLQRPAEVNGKDRLTPKEAKEFEQRRAQMRNGRGNRRPPDYSSEIFSETPIQADWTKRTSLITDPPDGKLPPTTDLAEKRRADRLAKAQDPDGPEDLNLADRCILGWHSGPPIMPGTQSNLMQIFQSKDHVVVYHELNHDARIVPLNVPNPKSEIRDYAGVSHGWWDKDTLIVETTNFRKEGIGTITFSREYGTDENMHLIERFTRVGPDGLLYEFTVDDPTTWTKPWTASMTMLKSNDRIYEFACHEGNYSMISVLENARAKEKAAAAKQTGGVKQREQ